MKKFLSMTLLLTAMFLTFSSCSKDDDKDYITEEETPHTRYVFSYKGDNPPQGTILSVTLFEYNEIGEKIAQNHIAYCTNDSSQGFIANKNSLKVKVYIVMATNSKKDANWVQQVYYLEKGQMTNITVMGQTRIGKEEP